MGNTHIINEKLHMFFNFRIKNEICCNITALLVKEKSSKTLIVFFYFKLYIDYKKLSKLKHLISLFIKSNENSLVLANENDNYYCYVLFMRDCLFALLIEKSFSKNIYKT